LPPFFKRRFDLLRGFDLLHGFEPTPRTDLVQFASICDVALDHFKNYTRCWDAAETRIKVFKTWWKGRTAESITTSEIDAQLLANVAPRGAQWSKTTSNEYRTMLLRIFTLAVDAGTVSRNPVIKVKRHKLENARTRELSAEEEDRLRTAIRAKCPHKEPEFDLLLHLGCRKSNLYGQLRPVQCQACTDGSATVGGRQSRLPRCLIQAVEVGEAIPCSNQRQCSRGIQVVARTQRW
jgi:hypothetical protein